MDEMLERSVAANAIGTDFNSPNQPRSIYFHSQQPPRALVEATNIKSAQLDREYLNERINDPGPPPLNPEVDRIDTKALKDIEINIHLEPPRPTYETSELGSSLFNRTGLQTASASESRANFNTNSEGSSVPALQNPRRALPFL